jgi:bifunctional DNA-binding transcriptional regulator/antitoxin component of YhaV-PrlF toxin-antitoxin module
MLYEKTQITGKGQIQLPVKIRQSMGANIGDEVVFKQNDKGEIVVELITKGKLSELAGVLPVKREFPGTDAEEEVTRTKVAEKAGKYDEAE